MTLPDSEASILGLNAIRFLAFEITQRKKLGLTIDFLPLITALTLCSFVDNADYRNRDFQIVPRRMKNLSEYR